MEIVLISDGPLPLGSPVRKLPFFFPARLVAMDKVSPRTVGEARVAVVELLDAGDEGLRALKRSWASMSGITTFCVAANQSRREMIQAAALGKTETVDRDLPLAFLIRRIRSELAQDLAAHVPDDVGAETVQAYVNASNALDGLTLSSADGCKIQVAVLNDCAGEILNALSRYGISDWMHAINSHHSATYRHSLTVAGLAGHFCRHLGWDEEFCREMVAGGLLHDIGKTRIPLTILDKPDKLSDRERALIDRHPEFGREILKPRLEVPVDMKKIAIQHHEYLDGTGYPDGLSAPKISQKVRIMTICDIFTALTEQRSYKECLPARVAVDMMRDMGGKLDAGLLEQFAELALGQDFAQLSRSPQAADA